jgi:hypothetical protein
MSRKWVLTRVFLGLVLSLIWGSPSSWAARIDIQADNLDATSITLGGREISSWDEIEGSGGTLNADNVAITGGTIANTDIDNADISNSRITSSSMANGTIDNTPIGLTTPSAGVFTTLATDNVSNIEFSYLEGLSSNLQLQLNGLRPLTDLDFTGMGVATFDNDVIAAAFLSTCDPSLNECVINVSNAGKRTGTYPGDISVDNSVNTPYIRSNDNTAEIPFVLDNNSITFTNKTFDASATGNVLKQTKYLYLDTPSWASGTAAEFDNTYHDVTFSNSADKANNCAVYATTVPDDLDNTVAMSARFKYELLGADTATHLYVILMKSIANSASVTGDYGSLGNEIAFDANSDATGANADLETVGWKTLTGWATAVTPGHLWVISVCRDGNDASDASTVDSFSHSLTIRYGSVQ